jgi:mono/diheme cytochrome c family protein
MNRGTQLVLATLIAVVSMQPVHADDSVGHQVFTKWCAPCHSRGPGNPGTAALAAVYKNSKPAALEDRTDLTPAFIKQAVRSGVNVMPYFRKTEISDAELDALSAYLSRAPKAK